MTCEVFDARGLGRISQEKMSEQHRERSAREREREAVAQPAPKPAHDPFREFAADRRKVGA